MKLEFLFNFKMNEVEGFAKVSMLLGLALFLTACFWDNIIGVSMPHHEGYGWRQIVVISVSGLYTFWAWCVQQKWKE